MRRSAYIYIRMYVVSLSFLRPSRSHPLFMRSKKERRERKGNEKEIRWFYFGGPLVSRAPSTSPYLDLLLCSLLVCFPIFSLSLFLSVDVNGVWGYCRSGCDSVPYKMSGFDRWGHSSTAGGVRLPVPAARRGIPVDDATRGASTRRPGSRA